MFMYFARMLLVCFVFLISQSSEVFATHIFLDAEQTVHSFSDVFYVPVRVDTQGECINAVSVAVSYNPHEVSVQDVALGESIITLWTKKPIIEKTDGVVEKGRVTFEGGIPGGYCGHVVGDPGQTNTLAKLVVSGVQKTDLPVEGEVWPAQLILDPTTQVFLHDGKGSVASTTLLGVEISFTSTSTVSENVWLPDVKSDVIAPELFEITLVEGPSPGNTKHYIVFNTTDKQSGVDHYEVLETDPDKFGFLTWVPRESYWVHAESPYVLRDQNLHSKIMVKAIDKNGNERIVTYTPNISPFVEMVGPTFVIFVVVPVILAILVFVVVFRIIRNRRKKNISEEFFTQE